MAMQFLSYNQHIHYERHLKYSKLRHLLLLPLIAWVVIYFSFPEIPTDAKLPVNVSAFPSIERFLFFGTFLPHQLLLKISNPFLDILAAIPYTMHMANPAVFVLACYTVLKQRITILPYLHCLGAMNILGVIIQYLFPTAPPWYYDKYGLNEASYSMKGDAAGLIRVDTLLGTRFYYNMFQANAIVFGSFPSLHVGWAALICLFILSWDGWKKLKRFAMFYVGLLCFSVVYLQHHYVVDVIGGLVLAVIVKKLVPMPPLSTSLVITTTSTTTTNVPGPNQVTTTTTATMIPLDTFATNNNGDDEELENPSIMIPIATPTSSPLMFPSGYILAIPSSPSIRSPHVSRSISTGTSPLLIQRKNSVQHPRFSLTGFANSARISSASPSIKSPLLKPSNKLVAPLNLNSVNEHYEITIDE